MGDLRRLPSARRRPRPWTCHSLRIDRAANDLLFDDQGRRYIDLFTAHGTTWLGHANPAIAADLIEQVGRVWITGSLETEVALRARALVEGFFPPSHAVHGFYSTGMEAVEFVIRMAVCATGRSGLVGCSRRMHGKSMATAALCWGNGAMPSPPDFHRLPFPPEESILQALEGLLDLKQIAAVFIEPIQGCGGGHRASAGFYRRASQLCRERGGLLVFDELPTAWHRTGPLFFFSDLRIVPDVILIGKALGHGFPVSAVVADREVPTLGRMMPGSTFSGNPLAAAAVAATIRQFQSIDLRSRVSAISQGIQSGLGSLGARGISLRGRRAVWALELPESLDIGRIVETVYLRGVAVGFAGRFIRLLPPATIRDERLAEACAVIRDVLTGEGP